MEPLTFVVILVVGFFTGVFGAIIGSTLLILTPLLHFLGLPIHTAIGTGKISVLSRELIPIFEYNRHNLIDFKICIPFIISGAVFSFFGSKIILSLSESIVKIIVGLFMIIVSLLILLNSNIGMREKKIKASYKTLVLGIVFGALIGFYQGIFGGGANVFIIFAFIFTFGNTFLKAVANSKAPNLIFAIVSSLVFIKNSYVNWSFAIPLLISTAIGSFFGAKLAIKKGNKFIRTLFILLVIIMAIKLLFF